MCHDKTGGHSSPQHGGYGENSGNTCITTSTDTCKTTSTDTISEDKHQESRVESQDTYTISDKWVWNLSKTPLTEAQEHLLGHGPNFVLVPRSTNLRVHSHH